MTNENKIEKVLRREGLLNKNQAFSWYDDGSYVPEYCPEYFDTNKYDWTYNSYTVIQYCPEKLDLKKANLENIIFYISKYKGMSLIEIKKQAILSKL